MHASWICALWCVELFQLSPCAVSSVDGGGERTAQGERGGDVDGRSAVHGHHGHTHCARNIYPSAGKRSVKRGWRHRHRRPRYRGSGGSLDVFEHFRNSHCRVARSLLRCLKSLEQLSGEVKFFQFGC